MKEIPDWKIQNKLNKTLCLHSVSSFFLFKANNYLWQRNLIGNIKSNFWLTESNFDFVSMFSNDVKEFVLKKNYLISSIN